MDIFRRLLDEFQCAECRSRCSGPGHASEPPPGGGYGLVGLAERVRTQGGRLSAGPRLDGGFEVEAVLPA